MAKHWIATISVDHWIWTGVDHQQLVAYAIWQLEKSEQTGYTHYQLYVKAAKKCRFSALKMCFGEGHWEIARRPQSAMNYCSKEATRVDGPWEYGDKPVIFERGRSDWLAIKELIMRGERLENIAVDYPAQYARCTRGIKELRKLYLKTHTRDFRKVHVRVIWGDTGTGKTRRAVEDNPDHYILQLGDQQQTWFDDYDGEQCLIMDDFYGQIKIAWLLRLLDGYQCRLPIKLGHTYANWTKVEITSNVPPVQWYKNIPDKVRDALARRIHEIRKIDEIQYDLMLRNEKRKRIEPIIGIQKQCKIIKLYD